MDINQILGNLGFDWRVALANLVNFLIILLILRRFAFKPIEAKLKEREDKIKKGIDDAVKAGTELQMAKQTSEKMLLGARSEGNEIVGIAQKEAEKILAESKIQKEEQAKKIVAMAEKAIEGEKEKMLQGIKKEVVDLVIATTEKFTKGVVTKEKQEEITKELIKG